MGALLYCVGSGGLSLEVGLLAAVARFDRNSSACRTPGAQTIFGFAFASILAHPSVIPSLVVSLSEEAVGGIEDLSPDGA